MRIGEPTPTSPLRWEGSAMRIGEPTPTLPKGGRAMRIGKCTNWEMHELGKGVAQFEQSLCTLCADRLHKLCKGSAQNVHTSCTISAQHSEVMIGGNKDSRKSVFLPFLLFLRDNQIKRICVTISVGSVGSA